MPLMWRDAALFMEWCLDCHRHPERYVGPRELVFAVDQPSARERIEDAAALVDEYHVQSKLDCSICHR